MEMFLTGFGTVLMGVVSAVLCGCMAILSKY